MDPASGFYQGEQGRQYHEVKRRIPPEALPWVHALRAEKLRPWIREEDSVFEYGVGSGWNLANVSCRRKTGFDVRPELKERVESLRIEFYANTAHLPAGSFNLVLCHHTLEHLPDPVRALGEMKRLLAPEGRLLLVVPYEKQRRYRHYDPNEPNHHLYSWNVQTLGNLVAVAGFQVGSTWLANEGYDRFSAVWALKLRLGQRGFLMLRQLFLLLKPVYEIGLLASPRPV